MTNRILLTSRQSYVIIKPSNNLCESEGASPMKFRKNPVEIVSVALCVVTALFSLVTIGYVMIA